MSMKVRDVIKRLQREGWSLKATKGSHRQFTHPEISGKVTVAGKPNSELKRGTLNGIKIQAGWK